MYVIGSAHEYVFVFDTIILIQSDLVNDDRMTWFWFWSRRPSAGHVCLSRTGGGVSGVGNDWPMRVNEWMDRRVLRRNIRSLWCSFIRLTSVLLEQQLSWMDGSELGPSCHINKSCGSWIINILGHNYEIKSWHNKLKLSCYMIVDTCDSWSFISTGTGTALFSLSHGPRLREPALTTDQHSERQLVQSCRKFSSVYTCDSDL